MAVYIIARSAEYTRDGIDNIGDIISIYNGSEPPSGPGYANLDVIKVEMTEEELRAKLDSLTPSWAFDEKTMTPYWTDPESENEYEIKTQPKYALNLEDLTLADKAILASQESSSVEQHAVLDKIQANVTRYTENFQTLHPKSE